MKDEKIPSEVATPDLGTPLGEFKGKTYQAIIFFIVGVVVLLVGLSMFSALVIPLVDDKVSWPNPLNVVSGGSAFVCAGGILCWKAHSLRRLRVRAYARGLVREKGGSSRTALWEDVESVTRVLHAQPNEFTFTTPSRLIVKLKDGTAWVFNESLTGLKDLRAVVEEHTLKHLLPAAIRDIENGKNINFMPGFSMDHQGLFLSDRDLKWSQLRQATLSKGILAIYAGDASQAHTLLDISGFPNSHLYMGLIERFRPRS